MSAPQMVERMVKLENCVWSLASTILLVPEGAIDSETRRKLLEEARALLHESRVLDHNLELPLRAGTGPVDSDAGEITMLFPPTQRT
ncbi:MAG TPA: hypothetical protein VGD60_00800 [Candidatus Acidoferrales bacterium]